MTDLPTHRHKKSGDVVFWRADMPHKSRYEKLPRGYWEARINEETLAAKIRDIKLEAARRILARWPVHKQLNAIHEPDAPWVATMREEIKAIRAWSDKEEAKYR